MTVTESLTLAILSANLRSGGIGRSRTEDRFDALLDHLTQARPDVLAAQELLHWDEHEHRLFGEAQRQLRMTGVLGISPLTRMHTAVFVRAPLRIAEYRVDSSGIWHHGATHALITWDAHDDVPAGRLRVASVHLSPRNPARRLLEAGELTGYGLSSDPALLLGDFNTQDEHTDLTDVPPDLLARYARLGTAVPDTSPIDLLASAGLADLGAQAVGSGAASGRTTGHWPGKQHLHGRPDRALGNSRAAAALLDYTVLTTAEDLSDHHWLRLRLSRSALADRRASALPSPANHPYSAKQGEVRTH